jgi:Ca2+-binding RTX toxin-like protein
VIYGEQGDDEIWGSQTTTTQHLHGGSGNDSVYTGYQNAGKTYAYGGSGEDIVRSDWFDM